MYRKNNIKFIDLFAGIGGFHQAMKDFGGECVFASEMDVDCQSVYFENYKMIPCGDITTIGENNIPSHDILFAGFPCQPFSKGGFRKGFNDIRGNLFFDIVRILKHHQPKYFLLENVSNLVTHDNGNTYKIITETLKKIGYSIPQKPLILSPNQFGLPVLRKRIYIPGVKKDFDNYENKFDTLLSEKNKGKLSSYSILNNKYNIKLLEISTYEKGVIEMWNDFYKIIDIKVIGFPVWSNYFKISENDIPKNTPKWKRDFILKNIDLYNRNKKNIDLWFKKYNNLDWVKETHKKFEWQAGKDIKDIYDSLIQFRPSGVRVKRPDYFSTLVAMNHNQIIGKFLRRAHPEEVKILQSFDQKFKLHKDKNIALKQLGNAVNVEVVKRVLSIMLNKNK
ncbi:MAG TPA: DNA (cytosine-5-)-methyltransferase [Candidatus Paceibacterota bacterium]|nr:DNA (cytosine-5-)-methyltransferase [Candidatus Paceibacterota bacterium]HMP19037.1 DNA (cytosine-5-)-methyltransferase [Candidatus Paceibacterota bacterium]HMP85198.1 DNA (cytosine-5-)-methyltransferase [Candidatus Paceibacterota bacterium]